MATTTDQQRKANVRLGLILAVVAACIGLGFMAKLTFGGG